MVIVQRGRKNRKITGGRYKPSREKRKSELGRIPTLTGIGKKRIKFLRTKGGNSKVRLLTAEVANVYDPKTKKFSQAKIKTVIENPADHHYVRRNIINKGTIIDTERGKAKVTSRPGQDGVLNAVLIS